MCLLDYEKQMSIKAFFEEMRKVWSDLWKFNFHNDGGREFIHPLTRIKVYDTFYVYI